MSKTLMITFHHCYLAIFIVFLAIIAGSTPGFTQSNTDITALINGVVIDGTGRPPCNHCTILIRRNRIAAVGTNITVPKSAKVIDMKGKTVIPGLIDMHGHLYARTRPSPAPVTNQYDAYPLLYLAGGVTTIRSPGDYDPEGMIQLRERIKNNEVIGPRVFTAGPYFDSAPSRVRWIKGVKTPEEALNQFNQWKSRIDLVKIYTSITEPQLRVVIDAARKAGLPVTGHLGSISATRAIEMGINGLEHGIFEMSELASSRGDWKAQYCTLADLNLDSPVVERLVSAIVKNHVVIDPTIIVWQSELPGFEVTNDSSKYLSPEAKAYVSDETAKMEAIDSGEYQCLRRAIEKQKQFVKRVHDRGGIIVAGTDPVWPVAVPGYGIHQELKYFVEAGLTPIAAIKTATLNAATALGREADLGIIKPGKIADLVVIEGNPATNIEELDKVVLVFKEGVQYDPKHLRKLAEGKIR